VSTERDGARPGHYPRTRIGFKEFAKCTRVIRKRRYTRRRRTTRVSNVGLQQRWELTLTRISLRQAHAFASSVSSNPRPMRNYTYITRACTADVLFAPKQKPERLSNGLSLYISQPCYILPSISSLTSSFWVALAILHGHRDTRMSYYNGAIPP